MYLPVNVPALSLAVVLLSISDASGLLVRKGMDMALGVCYRPNLELAMNEKSELTSFSFISLHSL